MPHRDLKVLEAAEHAADRVNRLIDRPSGRRVLHANQMRRSAQSTSGNISEGFGRGTDGDKARLLRIARGEAEETIRHLNANHRARRVSNKEYWPIYNLLRVIVKMLDGLLRHTY